MKKRFFLIFLLLLPYSPGMARHDSNHPLSEEEWREVMEKVTLLDDTVFIPSLLPTIMTNKHALNLTATQLQRLIAWRKQHYVPMINTMNKIIELKVQFRIESLSKKIDDAHLIAFQKDILQLQQELLKTRLSCRKILIETFTDEQWDNLEFIVSNNEKLASFISQSRTIQPHHHH